MSELLSGEAQRCYEKHHDKDFLKHCLYDFLLFSCVSDGRDLLPGAYCGGAFLIALAHSVSSRLFQSKQESERRSGWRGSGRTAAKLVQTESRISSMLEYYAEVQPILCKGSAIIINSKNNNVNI